MRMGHLPCRIMSHQIGGPAGGLVGNDDQVIGVAICGLHGAGGGSDEGREGGLGADGEGGLLADTAFLGQLIHLVLIILNRTSKPLMMHGRAESRQWDF